ncbi:SAM-dependent methyltransferase [Inhella inkyongensis]|uniref:SAM-dependent methyltransferase n=1 Tax=Inhella inkyongensis TaxID=392593 RepID=A0A840S793_9BURK|nr:DUF938 domain-containing protein [Inhella inkyongensis]MBB5204876.1 SAM-dependent methyltransferase [Inhella inkyongensis]
MHFHSPAAERNKQPILEQLQRLLPPQGRALEIASGSGQHARHFLAGLPGWTWQPSEFDADKRAGLQQLQLELGPRCLPPLALDVSAPDWPVDAAGFELIFCANVLHIAPWACCAGLMQGAARHLAPGGCLVSYGPYLESDVPTAPSNLAFDADLKSRNPGWGLRNLDAVRVEAARAGLYLRERVAMPANNLLLVWGPGQAG